MPPPPTSPPSHPLAASTSGTPGRPRLLARSPFSATAVGTAVALAYLIATLAWVTAGEALPGGRWLAVHLFTLGALTNAVVTFSQHFGHTVTRAPGDVTTDLTVLLNLGVVPTLIGVVTGTTWLLAVGATLATTAVAIGYARLRRARRSAVGARFAWIARVYERAHGAFVHGALLGLLLGTGLLGGRWYLAGRVAHLHVNVLGWGVLTLLATLVFFGPTMVRTRIRSGADDAAARGLRRGASGLTVAVLALLATGVGGVLGTGSRVLAAAGLATLAWYASRVLADVVAAAVAAVPSAPRAPVVALSLWLVVALWLDVVVVAIGSWRWLDVLGLVVLVAVLGQAVLATVTYLAPMLRGRTSRDRAVITARLASRSTTRTVGFNLGVLAAVLAAVLRMAGADGQALATVGWAMITAAALHLVVAAARPVATATDDETPAP